MKCPACKSVVDEGAELCLRCGELASAPYVAAEATIPDRPGRLDASRTAVATVSVMLAATSAEWPVEDAATTLRALEAELLTAGLEGVQVLARLALGLVVAAAGTPTRSSAEVLQMVAHSLELADEGPAG